jgi:POT family proton-dependent oligopeptide transporter
VEISLTKSFNKNIIGQITAIFFIEASSAAAFAVFFSGLSLYLTQKELYSKEAAAVITGLFLSFNYFLQLVGGMIANRIITYKKLYCLGSVVSVAGCLLLAYGINLKVGLALFLMSSLVTNVCLRMFITRLFHDDQVSERRIAFIWNYVGMNLGFLIGGFLSGYYTILNSYSHLFITMSILTVLSVLLTFAFIENNYSDHLVRKSNAYQLGLSSLIMLGLVMFIFALFSYPETAQKYLTILSVVLLGGLIHYGYTKSGSTEKKKFLKFSFYSVLAIAFWTVYMLTPTAFMQIIDNDVDQTILGFTIAPQWLVNMDAIVILTICPLFAYLLNRQNNKKTKSLRTGSYFIFSFLFTTTAFVILLVGLYASVNHGKLPILGMLGYLVFLTFGEIFISPIGDSLVGELIPLSMRDLMTGASSINIGIGGLLASLIANNYILPYVDKKGLVGTNLIQFQSIILVVSCSLALLTAVLYLFSGGSKNRHDLLGETKI